VTISSLPVWSHQLPHYSYGYGAIGKF